MVFDTCGIPIPGIPGIPGLWVVLIYILVSNIDSKHFELDLYISLRYLSSSQLT